MTDPESATNAAPDAPAASSEPGTGEAAGSTAPPADPASQRRRPWPAPSPDGDWWRGRTAAAAAPTAPPTAPPAAPLVEATIVDAIVVEDTSPAADADGTGPFDGPPRRTSLPARTQPPRRREPTPAPLLQLPPVPIPLRGPTPPEPPPTPRTPPTSVVPSAVPPALPTQSGPTDAPLSGRAAMRTPPPPARATRAPRPRRDPLRPWLALPLLVLFAFLATFLAWVSAEPFWLSLGHGRAGTAIVIASGRGPTCQASFRSSDGAIDVAKVRLAGPAPQACVAGTKLPARMVSASSGSAYSTDAGGLTLRWGIGFGLVLVIGVLIAWVTGAARYRAWRRGVAFGLSIGAPIAIALAMLAVTY